MKSDLLNLLKILAQSDLEFVLVGGFAGVIHGSSEVTRDIDICMNMDEISIQELRSILSEYDPRHRMHPKKLSFLKYPEDLDSLKNIYLTTQLGVLDVLGEIKGLGLLSDIQPFAQYVNISQKDKVRVLSKKQLIKAKKVMGRPKDLRVAEELESIS
ncbi:nucleotidyltransferase [bacterium]|nr:nucleotidyltransferase [bacterium]